MEKRIVKKRVSSAISPIRDIAFFTHWLSHLRNWFSCRNPYYRFAPLYPCLRKNHEQKNRRRTRPTDCFFTGRISVYDEQIRHTQRTPGEPGGIATMTMKAYCMVQKEKNIATSGGKYLRQYFQVLFTLTATKFGVRTRLLIDTEANVDNSS